MKKVVTRYAPSPTGKLHLGGARTAIFSYLFAKAMDGEFIIRIEDTDIERNLADGEQEQIKNLNWLGIYADLQPGVSDPKGPFRQSERQEFYLKYVGKLLDAKLAYKCYCTEEELQRSREEQLEKGHSSPRYDRRCLHNPPKDVEGKPYSVRIFVPGNLEISWNDAVRGKITVPSKALDDWIILKSNGIPTYNFANVIDDHLMEVTHVFRGEEHLANTPKQIYLYQAFNWKIPTFAHNTIIVNERGNKLSKRDKNTEQFISNYSERGFLPEAVFNYLTFLGWTAQSEREIYSKKELSKIFSLKGFSKSPSKFSFHKLQWFNNQYIKKLDDEALYSFLNPFVLDVKLDKEEKIKIFKLFSAQLREGSEIANLMTLFVEDEQKDIKKLGEIYLQNKDFFDLLINKFEKLDQESWSFEQICQIVDHLGEEFKLKRKELLFPIRMILTGRNSGPSIYKIIEIFGKEKTLTRLYKVQNGEN